MKFFTFCYSMILLVLISDAYAISSVECQPSSDARAKVIITFRKNIDPKKPFIGFYEWGAVLKIQHTTPSKSYENVSVRMTPEVYYSDINLRGDAEGVQIRLYPQFTEEGEFVNYTGQLFVNDLDRKAYFNFTNKNGLPGLVCK